MPQPSTSCSRPAVDLSDAKFRSDNHVPFCRADGHFNSQNLKEFIAMLTIEPMPSFAVDQLLAAVILSASGVKSAPA
jgi:hypothetical protein